VTLFIFSHPSIPIVVATTDETIRHFSTWLDSGKLEVNYYTLAAPALIVDENVCKACLAIKWSGASCMIIIGSLLIPSRSWPDFLRSRFHHFSPFISICKHLPLPVHFASFPFLLVFSTFVSFVPFLNLFPMMFVLIADASAR